MIDIISTNVGRRAPTSYSIMPRFLWLMFLRGKNLAKAETQQPPTAAAGAGLAGAGGHPLKAQGGAPPGRVLINSRCPLYPAPRKRTFALHQPMSALCRLCCKSRFALVIKILLGRGFRVRM